MDYISSKNICLLTRDMLKFMNERIMRHGSRTSYILCKMLECKGDYEEFELAEICFFATLHDIGAYKTDKDTDILTYEMRDYMPHSIYGYLFLRYLSPMSDKSKILLYHNIPYALVQNIEYEYKEIVNYLNLAEKVDIFSQTLGEEYDVNMFDKYAENKFSKEALELYHRALEEHEILEKIKTEEYQYELDWILSHLVFTNEEKKQYMEMLMYCMGFRHEKLVIRSVTRVCITEALAKEFMLAAEDKEILYYGALLHDVGLLYVDDDILNKEGKLTKEELIFIHKRQKKAEEKLSNRLQQSIIDLISSHNSWEIANGNEKKTRVISMKENILRVADRISHFININDYDPIKDKDKVLAMITEDLEKHRYKSNILENVIKSYDDIMTHIEIEKNKILRMHTKMTKQLERVNEKFQL